jgi:enolase
LAEIESIEWLGIYNSHVEPTVEYTVRLIGGACGRGAAPHGETIGIYEDQGRLVEGAKVVDAIAADGVLGREADQESFDAYLSDKADAFGKNTCYALSLALCEAVESPSSGSCRVASGSPDPPRLCCNILNGSRHAYTNPVLSDFQEYILVARTDDVGEAIEAHAEVQRAVHDGLLVLPKTVVSGNPVSRFATPDNRECIEFLLGVRDGLGLSDTFDLMIDASGTDLWTEDGYRLPIADGSVYSADEFCDYWLDLARQYPLRFLEDPFGEQDVDSWARLTSSQDTCEVIGDNFYSSDAARIEAGAAAGCTTGVIVKPNQAGSVTAVRRAIEAASRSGQTAIVSHRSVSTETPFEATLACSYGVPYIKIGPLLTDYSSVIRLNEIIRLTAKG